MSLIRRGIESRNTYPQFAQTMNPLNVLYGSSSVWSSAGERVDEITAVGITTVLSCVSLLADTAASLSLRQYEGDESRGFEPDREVPLSPVIADPDPEESDQFQLIHQMLVSLGLHGVSITHVERDSRGREVGLTPLHPYQTQILPAKNSTGRMFIHMGRDLPREDVLFTPWFASPQALTGLSPLSAQRSMMGLSLALDRYLAQWYAEGGTPSGILETDRPLTAEAATNLRNQWEAQHRKHRRPAVLTDGLKWRPIQASAVDMDFVATYELIQQQVCRVYRVPPALLNIKSAAQDYANVEQSSINFLVYTLQPLLRRIEIALSKVLPPGQYVRFDPAPLLRLDAKTAAEVDRIRITSGTRNRNELRLRDGLQPYDGGDEFLVALGQATDAAPEPDGVNG